MVCGVQPATDCRERNVPATWLDKAAELACPVPFLPASVNLRSNQISLELLWADRVHPSNNLCPQIYLPYRLMRQPLV